MAGRIIETGLTVPQPPIILQLGFQSSIGKKFFISRNLTIIVCHLYSNYLIRIEKTGFSLQLTFPVEQLRDNLPLLWVDGQLAWVAGVGVAAAFRCPSR